MEFRVRIPLVHTLGIELVDLQPGQAVLAVEVAENLTNSWGVAHGGLTMTLLDVAMAHAARNPAELDGPVQAGAVTIEMKTTFMRPGKGRLLARARCVHRTASLAFCEAEVRGADDELVAQATGTFKHLRGLPAGDRGRDIHRPDASD
ncbi:MAG: PaaI family thioesterase [Rubrivivax sp.]